MEWLNRANAIYVDQGIPGLLKQYGPKFRDYVTSEGDKYWLHGKSPRDDGPAKPLSQKFDSYTEAFDQREKMYSGESSGEQVWTMKITPKMREHFGKGVALSGAGLLGLGALPNDNQ